MAILTPVKALCTRLAADPGWKALLLAHGFDPAAADLTTELQKTLTIQRGLMGFKDFADDAVRAIEPGSPSRSLLYHALASPNVLNSNDGTPLTVFPTPAELDAVENYIFGVKTPTLDEIKARFPGIPLAVVAFACEYRPASQTTHGRHADMVFARTGVARVGTRPPRYVPGFRGFFPEIPDDPFGIAVSPARYVAYLAVQLPGSPDDFLPMRFLKPKPDPNPDRNEPGDGTRKFWVPVHKLFPGKECLKGPTLTVSFQSAHVNEKIFRAQVRLKKPADPAIPTTPPYVITEGLAEFSAAPTLGPGWLVPTVHKHLVEAAKTPAGNDVTFTVKPGISNWGTVDLWDFGGTPKSAPNYLHARTEVLADGTHRDLNQFNTDPSTGTTLPVDQRVGRGKYKALHYVDFTADGSISVDCPQVQSVVGVAPKSLPAYSLVSAVDFFPSCDQQELSDWVRTNAVPEVLRENIWGSNPPTPLSNVRFPANLQLPTSPFQAIDVTITAILGLPIKPANSPVPGSPFANRHNHLPDDAAGIFFPGWDVSLDIMKLAGTKKVTHLAAYGLGSPFPEDSKLCAALSSFWPAVAPDVTRTMDMAAGANLSGTVIPLTDAEIGQVGGLPWDGVPGPQEIHIAGQPVAEYNSFIHTDYVANALADLFTLRLTSKIDSREYTDRIMALTYGYLALGVERTDKATNPALADLRAERGLWSVLSFTVINPGDPELTQAGLDTHTSPSGPVYRARVFRVLFRPDPTSRTGETPDYNPPANPANFQKRQMVISGRIELILSPNPQPTAPIVLLKTPTETKWRRGEVIVV